MKKKYNFTVHYCHKNPMSEEVCIRDNIKWMMHLQSETVNSALKTGLFKNKDIRNFPNTCSCLKCPKNHPTQIDGYAWYNFDISNRFSCKLRKSKVTYIHNRYGTWVGHLVAAELYEELVLNVADALYN